MNDSALRSDGSRRVAFVTAAAGAGIGAAIVRALADDGWSVVVTDAHGRRAFEHAERLSAEYGREFLPIHLDVTDFAAVAAAAEQAAAWQGGIDGLVNSAGWNKLEPLIEMSPETWQRTIDVDLTGTFNCLRNVVPLIVERGGGAVVNISSIAAWEMSTEHGAAYSAAKAGILALTRVAAAELGSKGVRVNAIAPALVDTPLVDRMLATPEKREAMAARYPLKRVGTAADAAAMARFLLSPDSGWITGQVLGLDGGMSTVRA